jgi:hypothetical protein
MKPIKAWAIALSTDDNFIPDFNAGPIKNILHIHSDKKSAEQLVNKLKNRWVVVPVLITPL